MKNRNLLYSIFIYIISSSAYSQAPEAFNYQGIIRDAGGQIMANKTITVKADIMDAPVSGNVVYSEDHSVLTNKFGLFNIAIGQGIYQNNTFSSINWGASNYYLEVFMDLSGQGGFISMGTSQLLSVTICTIC